MPPEALQLSRRQFLGTAGAAVAATAVATNLGPGLARIAQAAATSRAATAGDEFGIWGLQHADAAVVAGPFDDAFAADDAHIIHHAMPPAWRDRFMVGLPGAADPTRIR